jgi:hypothetical protein
VKTAIFLAVTISVLSASLSAGAVEIDCRKELDKITVLKETPGGLRPFKEQGRTVRVPVISATEGSSDLSAFDEGKPLVPGGVVHIPVGNQRFAEICWAYALKELADSLHFRDTGELVLSSPDHSGFWHIYSQIFAHKSYFARLSRRVASGELSMDQATTQAVKMLHSRPGSLNAKAAGFIVEAGSDEPTALSEAVVFGMVPDTLYDRPITSLSETKSLDNTLKSLVKTILTSPDRSSMFGSTDADGINSALYNLIVQDLQPYMKGSGENNHPPYRPGDKFSYNGQTYTPADFMSRVLNFDPSKFAMVIATQDNQDLVYQAIQDSLTAPKPVPVVMGFLVLNQKQAEKAGIWSENIFVGQQPQLAGGHDVLIVNAKVDDKGQLLGHIFQNSWGPQGLDANGNQATSAAQAGYNAVTVGYNNFLLGIQQGSDFVFSKDLLKLPKYENLHPSLSRSVRKKKQI